MSNYEHIKGRIKKIPRLENESNKDYFERATGMNFQKYSYIPDTITEALYDNDLQKKYTTIRGDIYKFIEYKDIDNFDYCDITKLGNGEYAFSTCFYNGGASLSEVLEDAILEFERLEARA